MTTLIIAIVFQALNAFLWYKIGYSSREDKLNKTPSFTFWNNDDVAMSVKKKSTGYEVKIFNKDIVEIK